jgi:hypothetical protein
VQTAQLNLGFTKIVAPVDKLLRFLPHPANDRWFFANAPNTHCRGHGEHHQGRPALPFSLAGTVALAVENIIVAEHRNRLGLMSHSPNALRIAGATGGEVELVEIRRLNCGPTGRAWA